MLATSTQNHTVQDLFARIVEARRVTDDLFDIVRPEALYDRPIPERHRIVFYIGHLEAFDWNLLNGRVLSAAKFAPELDRLFAFGIDPVGGGFPTDEPSDWPSIGQVREYVERVRAELDERIPGAGEGSALGEFSADLLLNVAIEHRLMHAETLAYMLHRLPYERKSPPVAADGGMRRSLSYSGSAPPMIEIPAGPVTLGLMRASGAFGWDNEYEEHTADLPSFSIDRYKVANADFLEFMRDGGYDGRAFWNETDWEWKEANRISHPAFWRPVGDAWVWRGMFAEFPLPADWPVYVSHAEASAYAKWAGKCLPAETQWQRAAYGAGGELRKFPWGSATPDSTRGNFDFESWDPTSTASHPAGASPFGVEDLLGNGWEWTATLFAPFPGFEPFPFYRGYSADFFDGKHYVIKGASPRTAACMLRPSFRNWFQPQYQYVYAGFRCVSNRLD